MIEFDEEKNLQLNEINCGAISETSRKELFELLTRFRNCIAFAMKEMGKTSTTEMHNKLMVDVPVAHRPYRLANSEKAILHVELFRVGCSVMTIIEENK